MDREVLLKDAYPLLDNADLPQEDKDLWREYLSKTSADAIFIFIDMVEEDSSILPLATEGLKKRIAAQSDQEALKKVYEEERDSLLSISTSN